MTTAQIILGGIGAYLIGREFLAEDELMHESEPLPEEAEGIDMVDVAEIGKLYDSEYIRPNGRVDKWWGDIVPSKKYLGREDEIRGHYLDPRKAIEHYNLHGIEFGNWMNQDDRVNFMYATMVSLSDMAKVLGVAQAEMGLRQRLQIALGARGKGGRVAAFYVGSPYSLINLTKTKGKGAFAHEFGHAIDEHVHWVTKGKRGMATSYSSGRITDPSQYPTDSIEYLFERVFDTLYFTEAGNPTRYYVEQGMRTPYYQSRVEVWARTFERYIEIKFEERGVVNKWAIDPDPYQPPKDLVRKASPWIQKIIKKAFK